MGLITGKIKVPYVTLFMADGHYKTIQFHVAWMTFFYTKFICFKVSLKDKKIR